MALDDLTQHLQYLDNYLDIAERWECAQYVGELSDEICQALHHHRTIRLICGASMGKTHFVLNELPKHFDTKRKYTLIIDFLNSVRDNQLSEGARKGAYFNCVSNGYFNRVDAIEHRLTNKSICNIEIFSDECSIVPEEFLKSVSCIVIDEEHLIGQHLQFRHKVAHRFLEFIASAQRQDVPILLMTATPLNRHFDAKDVIIKLNDPTKSHPVTYDLQRGLTPTNCIKWIDERLQDATASVIVMIDGKSKTTLLRMCEDKYGRGNVAFISSPNQNDENGCTRYLLDKSELPDKRIIISTSFICEGLNINNTNPIHILTFAEEVAHGAKIIQLAHRLRKQDRYITIGYKNTDNVYYKPKLQPQAKGRRKQNVKDEIAEYDNICTQLFGGGENTAVSFELWLNYLERYTEQSDIITRTFKTAKPNGRPKGRKDHQGLAKLYDTIITERTLSNNIRFDIYTTNNDKVVRCANGCTIIRHDYPSIGESILELFDFGIKCDNMRDKEIRALIKLYDAVKLYYLYNQGAQVRAYPDKTPLADICDLREEKKRIMLNGCMRTTSTEIIARNKIKEMQNAINEYKTASLKLLLTMEYPDSLPPNEFVSKWWEWKGTENKTPSEKMREQRDRKRNAPPRKKMTEEERRAKERERKRRFRANRN